MKRHGIGQACLVLLVFASGCGARTDPAARAVHALPLSIATPSGDRLHVSGAARLGQLDKRIVHGVCGALSSHATGGARVPYCVFWAGGGRTTARLEMSDTKTADAELIAAVPPTARRIVFDGAHGVRRGVVAAVGATRVGVVAWSNASMPGRIRVLDGYGRTILRSGRLRRSACDAYGEGGACSLEVPLAAAD